MATKKTEEVKEEVKKEPKKKTYVIRLPKERGNSAPQFVGTNSGTYMIKRGEDIEVPEDVYEVLKLSEAAKDAMYAYEEKVARKD